MNEQLFFPLLAVLCLLACGKIITQRIGAGRHTRTPIDSILYISVFFLFTSLAFLPPLFTAPLSGTVIAYAVGSAILNLGFQVCYTVALTSGPVGLTVLISSLSMLVPILGATFFLGESFGPLRIVGCALTLVALLLNTEFKKKEGGNSRKWGIAITLTFLFNGAASFWQKWFAVSPHGASIAGYNFFSYFLAALLGLLLLLVLWKARGITPSARPSRGLFGWCALVGLFLGSFQWFFTYSQRVLDASLLLPTFNGASTALMTVIGILFFRERPTVRRIVSTVVGVAAIVVFGFAK